ncbi:MAG: ImmA/IrrE family metallo-endopeptidase [Deltaproteobacteria bacterium]|nr:MAG: ImmA/IrrE family metallo-endopeptidase [Deltaproteobacteria bacterium]
MPPRRRHRKHPQTTPGTRRTRRHQRRPRPGTMTPPFHRTPDELLEELGITEPEDLDIEAIAQYCGATIVYEDLSGCEARLLGYGNRAIITVDRRARRERQRFSAGHELGHWMCDRGKVAFACTAQTFTMEWSIDNAEQRANRYAADLLLPFSIFRRFVRNRTITFATARDLARTFQTSLTATAIRLVELGCAPAVIVCSDAQGRRWFKRGSERFVSPLLWPREKPAPDTIAHQILHARLRPTGPRPVPAAAWFKLPAEHPPFTLLEDSIRMKSFVLSLLSWDDERRIIDLDLE